MILRELEIDYAKKQFNTDPEIAHMIETTFDLDPLFGMSAEDKMTQKQNGGITEIDYIISCNIVAFVRRAIREDDDFYSLEYEKQIDVLKKFAEEVQKENEPKAAPMFSDVISQTQENPDDDPNNPDNQDDDDKDPKKQPQGGKTNKDE